MLNAAIFMFGTIHSWENIGCVSFVPLIVQDIDTQGAYYTLQILSQYLYFEKGFLPFKKCQD